MKSGIALARGFSLAGSDDNGDNWVEKRYTREMKIPFPLER